MKSRLSRGKQNEALQIQAARNTRNIELNNRNDNPNGFIVKGSEFNKSIKLLKKAFPRKKRDQEYVSVIINVTDNHVSISMPGAEVFIKADSFGNFSAALPFRLFKNISMDQYLGETDYTFLFDHGMVSINNLKCNYPDIVFCHSTESHKMPPDPHGTMGESFGDYKESFLGLPLLGIYYELKKYPPGTLTHLRYMRGHAEIEDILNKVDKLLRPLGLGRDTIEKILDDRSPLKPKNKNIRS